jgi:M6 family metalloprotease-like protein
MPMKRKLIRSIPLLMLLSVGLSACEITFSLPTGSSTPITSEVSSASSDPESSSNSESVSIEPGSGYYRPSSYSIDQNDYNNGAGLFSLAASGNQKLLVIPVTFTDFPCGSACTTRRDNLEKTFFGETSDTGWESVASFYEKSSYGQLHLDGVVTPVYEASMSSSTFASNVRTSGDYADYYDPTWLIVEQAVAWYKTYSGSNLTEYDNDDDGFLDAVWVIYNNPNNQNYSYTAAGEEVFWAYTYWDYDNWNYSNLSSPVPMTYAWASYDFMYEGYGSAAVDAHTYIHETGHVLGLDDYYSYTEGDWGAAGGLDMMDYNVLDHNAYSKFFLGWSDPFVVDGTKTSTTITLDPFESSGQFILINDDWNGSAFDEYLAIEFYTPTGLNYQDSLPGGYPGNTVRGFTVPGLKIYHVDSRLGLFSNTTDAFISYTDSATGSPSSYPYIAHSNSVQYSADEDYKLLHLLESGGVNTFAEGYLADDDTLFRAR